MPRWNLKSGHQVMCLAILTLCGCAVSRPQAPVKEPRVAAVEPLRISEQETVQVRPAAFEDASASSIQMNLPTTLAMVGGDHPAIGQARWRIQEAYAQLELAEALWLPTLSAGASLHRHDGNYQASSGDIVDVNRNSLQAGLGTAATGAGTTPRPGIVAQFHLADAIFMPKVAEKKAWARGHAAAAVTNRQMLSAATAYLELLDAHQDVEILMLSRERIQGLLKITEDFAEAGEGLKSDSDRMKAELLLFENRLIGARERTSIASARLAQALSIDNSATIVPLDSAVVPLEYNVSTDLPTQLIATGLSTRPELKESSSLVAAACEAYRREKYAPLVPSVLLGFSTGAFGGGQGADIDEMGGRYDFDGALAWQVRNFGVGEHAARREKSAQVQQAKFAKLSVMDSIAFEITESASQVHFRRQQITITQQAIAAADDSYRRNLERIREGEGLPIEVLQSIQAIETAQRAHLRALVDHNNAQLRLQWAVGWPVG